MSTITVSNVSDGTISIPTNTVVNGSAKAWVNLNGTGTVAIRDSLNVSSLSDNGTGSYTTNYTNNFAAQDYALGGMSGRADNSLSNFAWVIQMLNPQVNFSRFQTKNNESDADNSWANTSVFGDLA